MLRKRRSETTPCPPLPLNCMLQSKLDIRMLRFCLSMHRKEEEKKKKKKEVRKDNLLHCERKQKKTGMRWKRNAVENVNHERKIATWFAA